LETGLEKQLTVNACPRCGCQYSLDVNLCPVDGSGLIRQMPDPLIGVMLPRHYRITGKLGRGAMSVVYRGVYEPLDQAVAVKLLKSHLVSDTQTFKRFQQEAKTAGALEHPNIVGIFDFGVTEQGVPYLIMELLHGESLGERLKREKCLPVESALDIFVQAADALDYTHKRGIVHRDVKPSNLLLEDHNGRTSVKIVDFGIAKLQSYEGNPALNLTATGEVFGTPLYVSPEQATGKNIDARADIYSLGCVMYEAIVGRPAFSGTTAFDVIRMQITTDPMPMNRARPDLELPPPLVAAVSRSMSKNPDDRYQTMADLLLDLNRAQSLTNTTRIAGAKTRTTASNEQRTLKDATNALNQPRAGQIPTSGEAISTIRETGLPGASSPLNSTSISKVTPALVLAPNLPQNYAAADGIRRTAPIIPILVAVLSGSFLGLVILLCFQSKLVMASFSGRTSPALSELHPATKSTQTMDLEASLHVNEAADSYAHHRYAEAAEEDRVAIKILESKNDKVGVAVTYSDLCRILVEDGRAKEALDAGQKAVDILKTAPASETLNLCVAMESLAQAAVACDNLVLADQLFSTALSKKRDLLSERDAEIAKSLQGLAITREMRGKYREAEDLYTRAQGIRKEKLGRNAPEVATTFRCLGTLYYDEKNYGLSEKRFISAKEIDTRNADSEALSRDEACLGKLYQAMKQNGKAEDSLRQSLKLSEEVYGHGSPKLIPRLKALAAFLKLQKKAVESEALERAISSIESGSTK
jgi:serine/threonine protein kinase